MFRGSGNPWFPQYPAFLFLYALAIFNTFNVVLIIEKITGYQIFDLIFNRNSNFFNTGIYSIAFFISNLNFPLSLL